MNNFWMAYSHYKHFWMTYSNYDFAWVIKQFISDMISSKNAHNGNWPFKIKLDYIHTHIGTDAFFIGQSDHILMN